MKISSKILEEIEQYCKANDIEDVEVFVNKMLRNGFNIEKYGEKPPWFQEKPKEEKIVEEFVEKLVENQTEDVPQVPDDKFMELIDDNPEIYPEIVEEFPDTEEEEVGDDETSKRYNIDIKINKPEKPDLYDEEEEPQRGFLGSNMFNRKK
jgi:pentatricopeptide repeat protein